MANEDRNDDMSRRRVAILGAGPSGLSSLHSFYTAASTTSSSSTVIPEIICYEKQAEWGGLWNYSWRTGLDETGEPVHASMYRNLWSNSPKECIEYPDYPFETHFNKPIGSYPPRAVIADYLKGRVTHIPKRWVKFRHVVRRVTYHEDIQKFDIVVQDLANNVQVNDHVDHVIVATGHFSTPNMPYFQGMDTFDGKGRILHSHDFRNAADFKDLHVLIVGASYSAEDIGSQCYKYGAKSVTASYRTRPMGFKWPKNWETKPLVTKVQGTTVHFKDASSKDVDAIILCTGYQHSFPFLDEPIKLQGENKIWLPQLYQGVAFENNPRIHYLGMHQQYFSLTLFDAQAWWSRDVILGKIQIPNTIQERKEHSAKWTQRHDTLITDKDKVWFQGDYIKSLIQQTDYPDLDVEAVNKIFVEWEHHKHQDIMGYRNNAYRSVVTNTLSPHFTTPWIKAMDDSMPYFLSHCKQANTTTNDDDDSNHRQDADTADYRGADARPARSTSPMPFARHLNILNKKPQKSPRQVSH
ncbi:Flavin-containing monooxygenase FMO GS-OX-like [Seminavis robusta]|uniref:Flavin-containing monooxygenase FMO GS-OX-like n=1 Tax=Seminavis robusta TaxID=568900 RepID=A0A9N8EJ24_9STRA|nr:Flavin-containing monooxygenase FMO GS-OX-like [Seminavis robusta]|eukprot:Sro1258_g256790.1 Flavin-containing monooxygenase FMO GS-OX-like (524) ;mRNA; f:6562-8391